MTDVTQAVGITTYEAERDGALVVEIDTSPEAREDTKGPLGLRIYLNDECIYENPALPAEVTLDAGSETC